MSRRLQVASGAESLVAELGWRSLPDVFATEGGQVFAKSGTSSTVLLHAPGGDAVFLKRYQYPRFAVHHAIRMSRPRREWRSLLTMSGLEVPVPAPVAWGEERRLRRLVRGCIATRAVPGGQDLEAYLRERQRPPRRLLVGFARAVSQMHSRGFAHGDLNLRNVILEDSGDAEPGFHFIDAPRGRRVRRSSDALAIDLANLDLDASRYLGERSRRVFLRHYLAPETGHPDRVLLEILRERVLRARLPLALAAERRARRRAERDGRR